MGGLIIPVNLGLGHCDLHTELEDQILALLWLSNHRSNIWATITKSGEMLSSDHRNTVAVGCTLQMNVINMLVLII